MGRLKTILPPGGGMDPFARLHIQAQQNPTPRCGRQWVAAAVLCPEDEVHRCKCNMGMHPHPRCRCECGRTKMREI